MTSRRDPWLPRAPWLAKLAFAVAVAAAARVALGAGPSAGSPADGRSAPGGLPEASTPGAAAPLELAAPAGDAPELPAGALVVRLGGDVSAARRHLGTEVTRADLRRIAALGADAVALDVRIDAGARPSLGGDGGLTLEGDARVVAAARLARAEGLAVLLWPVVVASPSGPRLDDQLGLLATGRLVRERNLRVAAGRLARRAGASGLVALDGRIGAATEVKRVPPDEARSALAAWRGGLAEALAEASAPTAYLVVEGAAGLASVLAGEVVVPPGLGIGAWASSPDAAAALGAAAGGRPSLIAVQHGGGDGGGLVAAADARDASAPAAALVVGTWRHGGGGALGALPRSVWERVAR